MKSDVPRERLLSKHELEHKPPARVPLSSTVARSAKCDMLGPQ